MIDRESCYRNEERFLQAGHTRSSLADRQGDVYLYPEDIYTHWGITREREGLNLKNTTKDTTKSLALPEKFTITSSPPPEHAGCIRYFCDLASAVGHFEVFVSNRQRRTEKDCKKSELASRWQLSARLGVE